MVVNDIDRPDVNGVPPKMQAVADKVKAELAGSLPFLTVQTDDNLCSSVIVRGAKEKPEDWPFKIFHNASYFILRIYPPSRYYTEGQNVTVEVTSSSKLPKLRKYTGSPDKVIAKVKAWVATL